MEMEQALTSSKIYSEEVETLSTVYSSFDKTIAEQTAEYISAKSYALSGNYEEQDTFIHYGTASRIGKKKFATARLISDLKSSPYFAHILIKDENNDEQIHCLMSDSETLDHMIQIDAKEQMMILPFKQEKGKEIYNQLFHLYQDKSGKRFTADAFTYQPLFIRNDDIFEQQLQSATQLFPAIEIKDEEIVDCDELLSRKLKENRRNSALSNIIATLQRQQYNIIQTPADKSFIVQGCAGSGKSQCMIHRLFFLRDVYAKEWDKVLLITPTQLFRNYSADLMRRYRLTGINNTSIADFYHEILNRIDSRFKNRQYKYELSEEYLPDEYLNQVYSENTIRKIKREIISAIRKHVKSTCELLGTEYNEDLISRKNIDTLDERLKNEIADFDHRESTLAQDNELKNARKRIDEIAKGITQLKNAQANLDKKLQDLSAEKEKFDRFCVSLDSAECEKKEWEQSIVLFMPRFVPWYESLFRIIEDGLTTSGAQRNIYKLEPTDTEPGKLLLNEFCKREVRSEYRIGKSYAEFLATRQALTLNSSIIWLRGLNKNQLVQWTKFINDYNKCLSKYTTGALFVLETNESSVSSVKGKIESLSFSSEISAYDKYTFCILASSSTSVSSDVMPYLAELVSSICSDDIELCAECIKYGKEFAKDPTACLKRIAENEVHSNGTPFEADLLFPGIEYHTWESQIRLLFPKIERFRTDFIKRHYKDIAYNLPITNNFDETIENPEDVEIGLLYALTKNGAIQMHSNEEFGILRFYKDVRNNLAHIKPVNYESVCRILEAKL